MKYDFICIFSALVLLTPNRNQLTTFRGDNNHKFYSYIK